MHEYSSKPRRERRCVGGEGVRWHVGGEGKGGWRCVGGDGRQRCVSGEGEGERRRGGGGDGGRSEAEGGEEAAVREAEGVAAAMSAVRVGEGGGLAAAVRVGCL